MIAPQSPHVSFLSQVERTQIALSLLQEAQGRARALGRDPWQFAVEINELRAAGVAGSDVRWLLCRGYVEHAAERVGGAHGRSFQPLTELALPQNACFVLTAEGAALAALAEMAKRAEAEQLVPSAVPAPAGVPSWNPMLRLLSWGGQVVKQFRLPAVNQETILESLEELGWPPRIDDPLPPVHGLDAKTRLHDAIKCLNRNQSNRLLCFRGDGTGRGICWSALPGAVPLISC